jgi:single-strand DNA-binding protein
MSTTITGKIIAIMPEVQVTEKFKKKEIVIETPDQYSQKIIVQAGNDKTALLNGLNIGDEVTAHVNVKGRAWEKDGKTSYFVSLELWKLDRSAAAETLSQPGDQPGQSLPF